MFLGGAPAARSFSVEGRKMMFLDRSSRCTGLLDRGEIVGDVAGGAPAARGCSIEGRKMMFLDRSSRCVGLLDRREKGDVSGGSSRCAELLGRGEKGDER